MEYSKYSVVECEEFGFLIFDRNETYPIGRVFHEKPTDWHAEYSTSDIGHDLIESKDKAVDLVIEHYEESKR